MNNEKISLTNKIILGAAVLIVLGIVIYAVFTSGNKIAAPNNTLSRIEGFAGDATMKQLSEATQCPLPTNKNYDEFAKCLTQKGETMYGAAWCPHCIEQKAAFGTSFKYINYVECPDNTQLCIDKGIQGYPTWLLSSATTSTSTTK